MPPLPRRCCWASCWLPWPSRCGCPAARRRSDMNIVGNNLADRLVLAAVIALAIVRVAPLVWVFALSFKANEFLTQGTDVIFSGPFTLKQYIDIIGNSTVFRWIVNSIIVALSQTLAMLGLASLAGYGFARTEFPGKNGLFVLVLAGPAVPGPGIR